MLGLACSVRSLTAMELATDGTLAAHLIQCIKVAANQQNCVPMLPAKECIVLIQHYRLPRGTW